MCDDVNEFLPALKSEDIQLDLSKITGAEQAIEERFSVDK